MKYLILTILTFSGSILLQAQHKVLILGTYHFGNPGQDTHNVEADDHLSPKRQAEIEAVVQKLSAYQPTMIFVERSANAQDRTASEYAAYRNGSKELTDFKGSVNEIYQLGYRLAKVEALDRVYAADAEGWWLQEIVDAFYEENPDEDYDTYVKMQSAEKARENDSFTEYTVLEHLIRLNGPEAMMDNHAYYNQVAVQAITRPMEGEYLFDVDSSKSILGMPQVYLGINQQNPGSELVGEWYKRNIKIYANILYYLRDQEESQNALIIFGSGHKRILEHLFGDNPDFELVNALEYLAD